MSRDIVKTWSVTFQVETGDIPKPEVLALLATRENRGDGVYLAYKGGKAFGLKKPVAKLITRKVHES